MTTRLVSGSKVGRESTGFARVSRYGQWQLLHYSAPCGRFRKVNGGLDLHISERHFSHLLRLRGKTAGFESRPSSRE